MLCDVNRLGRRARVLILAVTLFSLFVCLEFSARAQEAPRQVGSPIKPPMIKPPMPKSQTSKSVVKTKRRRRAVRRKRRATRGMTYTISSPPPTTNAAPPSDAAPGGGSTTSIKPPMANEGGASLNVQTMPRAPVSGGILNSKAVHLPKPVYSTEARTAGASGTVTVQVVVDEEGNVIEAQAVSGNPLLQAAAVEAARQAKFAPTRISGQPVQVKGFVTYNFVL